MRWMDSWKDLACLGKQELKQWAPADQIAFGQLARSSADLTREIRSADVVIYISVPCDVI